MADRNVVAWSKKLEKVFREAPKGYRFYVANGTAHVIKLGANGDRVKKSDGITFDDKAIVYTLEGVEIDMDGGDW